MQADRPLSPGPEGDVGSGTVPKGSEYQQSPRWKAHWHVIGTEEQQDYKDVG